MSSASPTAALLIIGNEILSGRTEDANLNYLANGLGEIGIRFMEARVVPDIEIMIIEAVNSLRKRYSYVFTTGGIGPTHDDITAAAIARAFDVELIRHPDAVAAIEKFYENREEELNEARLKMAEIPENGQLIENSVTLAPGFKVENVYVLAGIPKIMQVMFEAAKPDLLKGNVVKSRELSGALSESAIAADLTELQAKYPQADIGSYPYNDGDKYGTSIVIRCYDNAMLENAFKDLEALFNKYN